ncbi:hypothetical protein HMPREF3036_02591 [Sutterella sp. KLE1602]|nr:hypothetical protein HMPREF3036_02591 [Sutterella sp. KLE1602]
MRDIMRTASPFPECRARDEMKRTMKNGALPDEAGRRLVQGLCGA